MRAWEERKQTFQTALRGIVAFDLYFIRMLTIVCTFFFFYTGTTYVSYPGIWDQVDLSYPDEKTRHIYLGNCSQLSLCQAESDLVQWSASLSCTSFLFSFFIRLYISNMYPTETT